MPFICLLCLLCIYCFFPPFNLRWTPLLPLIIPLPPTTTSSTTVPLPSSFQASRAIPLSHISPTYLYLSVALGICCCYVTFLFQMHSLSLSPLDYLSDILCSLINIYKY